MFSRHEVQYQRIGNVHIYRVDLYEDDSELARMNHGEYCAETRVLVVAPNHNVLTIDNDAIDESRLVNAANYGYDATYPSHEETIAAIAAAIVAEAEKEYAEI